MKLSSAILTAAILANASLSAAQETSPCANDARKVFKAADAVIAAQGEQVLALSSLNLEIGKHNESLLEETDRLRAQQAAWYRNPWLLIGLGILSGVAVSR